MNKALIVVDVQNYFINEYTKDLPEKIASFIQEGEFKTVIFTKFINTNASNFVTVLGWDKMQSGPETDIHPALAPYLKTDNVFEKNSYSIFKCRKLSDYLSSHKIFNVTLCGFETDACILASQYDGFDAGMKVTVIDELCRSHTGKSFDDMALAIIHKNLQ